MRLRKQAAMEGVRPVSAVSSPRGPSRTRWVILRAFVPSWPRRQVKSRESSKELAVPLLENNHLIGLPASKALVRAVGPPDLDALVRGVGSEAEVKAWIALRQIS